MYGCGWGEVGVKPDFPGQRPPGVKVRACIVGVVCIYMCVGDRGSSIPHTPLYTRTSPPTNLTPKPTKKGLIPHNQPKSPHTSSRLTPQRNHNLNQTNRSGTRSCARRPPTSRRANCAWWCRCGPRTEGLIWVRRRGRERRWIGMDKGRKGEW